MVRSVEDKIISFVHVWADWYKDAYTGLFFHQQKGMPTFVIKIS